LKGAIRDNGTAKTFSPFFHYDFERIEPMAAITAAMVKELRETSGAGMMDCKAALEANDGNIEAAIDWLRKKGLSKAAKKSGRVAAEGLIGLKVDGKKGVLVEVNSETDFVARADDFKKFAHEVALQIAAASPKYVSDSQIPQAELDHEGAIAKARAMEEGKPEAVAGKIVEGRLNKYKDEVCLLRQPYIRDDSLTIQDLLNSTVAATGENVVIRRFHRWELGEGLGE